MKNGLKKVVSILLICMMMMGLSTTSFASDVPGDVVIPREPAAPVTSVTYAVYTWFEKEHCFEIRVKVRGFGFESAKFDGLPITSYKAPGWYEPVGSNNLAGWIYHYKTPRIFDPGLYEFSAVYTSYNYGGQKGYFDRTFAVTEDMLQ